VCYQNAAATDIARRVASLLAMLGDTGGLVHGQCSDRLEPDEGLRTDFHGAGDFQSQLSTATVRFCGFLGFKIGTWETKLMGKITKSPSRGTRFRGSFDAGVCGHRRRVVVAVRHCRAEAWTEGSGLYRYRLCGRRVHGRGAESRARDIDFLARHISSRAIPGKRRRR